MAGSGITAGRVMAGTPVTADDGTTIYQLQTTGSTGTASSPTVVKSAGFTYVGKNRITTSATSSTSIGAVPAGATVAIIQNKGTVDVAWAVGTAVATDQVILATTGVLTLDIGNTSLALVQFIAASGNFDLRITYYS